MRLKLLSIASTGHELLLSDFKHRKGIIDAEVINGVWILKFDTNTKVLQSFGVDWYSNKILKNTMIVDAPYRLISVIVDKPVHVDDNYNGIIHEALKNVKEKNGKYVAKIYKDDIINHHPAYIGN